MLLGSNIALIISMHPEYVPRDYNVLGEYCACPAYSASFSTNLRELDPFPWAITKSL
jgi:hypothetical protein